ncbi:glycosyltransferase family 4 protein [Streptomyces sp. NBC_01803]|uniref:glycosyltransferase family 4 protein n=1 Tax=Streptomyces sp. NBC_01803 TaxID=2975946 RepID=UPI002DDB2EAA|nr:glycosyltransferase family 1 protein [Streptomyces sp. NBC_01803]WSA47777.1 glycosyltransferase family 1 protein [Streptomyces sp. NBC_01803]
MRIVLITESYPPDVNGVAHCALQTAAHLTRRGHHPLVVAPAPAPGVRVPHDLASAGGGVDGGAPVVHIPSLPLPGYPQVRVALPSRKLAAAVAGHRPDIIHLASPFVLGARGAALAVRSGVPAVAVYQTDLAGYARTYLGAGELAAWRRIRAVHAAADLTLAPSSASLRALEEHGVPRVRLWPRGVDTRRFRPGLRDDALRGELAPGGELLVGYVGRLAPEKHIELLAGAAALPGVRLVVVGDGPSQTALRAALPRARFLGRRTGDDLARVYASLDVFAHTGPFETFCQTVQEAQASGVATIAPAVGGPLDLVEHGRTGLLVPPRDQAALRDAVRVLRDDPALRAALARAGRAAVEDRTWEAVGDQLLDHYARVRQERAVAVR